MIRLKGFPTVGEIKKASSAGRPLVLAPSVSANCNFNCIMCFVGSGKASSGEIGLEEHKLAIDQVSDLGAKYVIIAMVGEPFLDPAFYDKESESFPLVDYANEKGLYVVSFTNTSIATEENLRAAKQKGLSFIGKLWSLDQETDDFLTGIKKEWVDFKGQRIPKGLALMIEAGFNEVKDGETRLGIDVIVTSKNFKDIPEVVEWAIENNIYPVIDTMIPKERAKENYEKLKMNQEQNKWLYNQLAGIIGNSFTKGQFVQGCAVKRVGLAYDNFGNVKTCCTMEVDVGNIKETPIKELYKRIQEHRKTLPTYSKENGTMNSCDTAKFIKKQMGIL